MGGSSMRSTPAILTEEQAEIIIKYIRDRRYSFMVRMIAALVVAVLGLPLAVLEAQELFGSLERGVQGGAQLLAFRYRRRRRYRRGSLVAFWIICVFIGVTMFLQGIGKKFGIGSDLDCMLQKKYICEKKAFGAKSADAQKHPYFLIDEDNNSYYCPIFLDWKKAEPGNCLICVTLSNGNRYALLDKTTVKEWWEEEPC